MRRGTKDAHEIDSQAYHVVLCNKHGDILPAGAMMYDSFIE